MLSLSSDPIPNIRFNVAKGFETIIPLLKKLGTDNLKDVIGRLTAMKSDADVDVRFFSERALSVA